MERLGVPVFTSLPNTAEDLMQKYGITAEQAGDRSPDLMGCSARRRATHARTPPAIGRWPESRRSPSRQTNEVVRWIEDQRAVVAGDTLVDFGEGLEIRAVCVECVHACRV